MVLHVHACGHVDLEIGICKQSSRFGGTCMVHSVVHASLDVIRHELTGAHLNVKAVLFARTATLLDNVSQLVKCSDC